MTTDQPFNSEETNPEPTQPAESPESLEGRESNRSIDTSSYKPDWLETGRLFAAGTRPPDDSHPQEEARQLPHEEPQSQSTGVSDDLARDIRSPGVYGSPENEMVTDLDSEALLTASPATDPPGGDPPNRVRPVFGDKRPDRLSRGLLVASIILFIVAGLVYFLNPFTRLALGTASLARPVSSPENPLPRTGSGSWCLQGDFLEREGASPRFMDNGESGDILSNDLVFTLEYSIAQTGSHNWQVVDCENTALAYPQAPAWAVTTEPDQQVTFLFDSDEREDPLFFPIPFVVSALDDTVTYRIVGSFQDWDATDTSNRLEPLSSGIFQQVRRIARSGSYEAYVIAGEDGQSIDAYGRTTEPIPFSFETSRNGELVIFMLDEDRGRASVLYDMSPLMTSLAFGNGYRLLSLALAGLGLALLLGLILRLLVVRNPRFQMESGCPQCGEHELMRISRHTSDRLLNMIGIPAYRYRCRYCTWEGVRLSEHGRIVSPGATMAPADYHAHSE